MTTLKILGEAGFGFNQFRCMDAFIEVHNIFLPQIFSNSNEVPQLHLLDMDRQVL